MVSSGAESDGKRILSQPSLCYLGVHLIFPTGLSVAQVSAVATLGSDGSEVVVRAHRFLGESVRGATHTADEKCVSERLRNRTLPISSQGGGGANQQSDSVSQAAITSAYGQEGEQHRCLRRAMDGGVRLGGGRLGESVAPDHCDQRHSAVTSEASTLPPSYSSRFGESSR